MAAADACRGQPSARQDLPAAGGPCRARCAGVGELIIDSIMHLALARCLRWQVPKVRPQARPRRQWRTCHGYLRCTHHRRRGHACAVLCARERLGQHRQFADHRLQADGHELRRPDPRRPAVAPACRQRRRQCPHDQHGAGRHPGGIDLDLHGDQRRRFLCRAEAGAASTTIARSSTASTATRGAAISSPTRTAIWSTAPAIT